MSDQGFQGLMRPHAFIAKVCDHPECNNAPTKLVVAINPRNYIQMRASFGCDKHVASRETVLRKRFSFPGDTYVRVMDTRLGETFTVEELMRYAAR